MPGISRRLFTEFLNSLSEEELKNELKRLFSTFSVVQDLYLEELGEKDALLEKYKAAISREYFPKRGLGKRKNSHIRALFSEFKKLSSSKLDLMELHLHRTEEALRFLEAKRVRHEKVLPPVTASFETAVKIIVEFHLYEKYQQRLDLVLLSIDRLNSDFSKQFKETVERWK